MPVQPVLELQRFQTFRTQTIQVLPLDKHPLFVS